MQDIIVYLSRFVTIGEVHKPIPPTVGIVDRKRYDKRRALAEVIEYNSFCGSKPFIFACNCIRKI
ncbi:hypothetical protein [Breoghania sp.]|uniref:hypothetical protein n=1 Tax=Breoghania sp. TaxID=2065378 RepID=UPI0026299CEC|nr:hypothetical protein [Breoghania sp.]MDJ0931473.1 hypothetical protein [Breoghania sp.]